MARSHHRKKHKSHLQHFKHSQEMSKSTKVKTKASGVFAFGGIALGLLIGFFAGGSFIWMGVGLIVGGLLGYLIGSRIDKEK